MPQVDRAVPVQAQGHAGRRHEGAHTQRDPERSSTMYSRGWQKVKGQCKMAWLQCWRTKPTTFGGYWTHRSRASLTKDGIKRLRNPKRSQVPSPKTRGRREPGRKSNPRRTGPLRRLACEQQYSWNLLVDGRTTKSVYFYPQSRVESKSSLGGVWESPNLNSFTSPSIDPSKWFGAPFGGGDT